MIGDKIHILPTYIEQYNTIYKNIVQKIKTFEQRQVIIVGGESGSGKSVLAVCLATILANQGLPTYVIQLDDYFNLPPMTNHLTRVADINKVGIEEVNLKLLQQHLNDFLDNKATIIKPYSNYDTNSITYEDTPFGNSKILIIEGTYALYLKNAAYRIFINRNFEDTRSNRIARQRDVINDFSERVLAIEHQLVADSAKDLDCIVSKDYSLVFV